MNGLVIWSERKAVARAHTLRQWLELESEPAPLWWTSRKGLLSSEFRQCSREKFVQIHSRKTLFGA
jgi:hypothetical protein